MSVDGNIIDVNSSSGAHHTRIDSESIEGYKLFVGQVRRILDMSMCQP